MVFVSETQKWISGQFLSYWTQYEFPTMSVQSCACGSRSNDVVRNETVVASKSYEAVALLGHL